MGAALGYGWLVVAFTLRAAALLTPWVAPMAALHAFTVGAIGVMTLVVMTRASLGHSGRPLVASQMMMMAYALVTAGGILRVAAPHLSSLAEYGHVDRRCFVGRGLCLVRRPVLARSQPSADLFMTPPRVRAEI